MSKSQYDNIHLYLPLISACWNQTPSSITGISPFEAEHGMKARSISDSLTEETLDSSMPATAKDIATIIASAKAYNKIAANIQAIHKTQTALLLSKKGLTTKPFKVGMKVSFYKPPTAADIARAGRKAKHLTQFHGPAVLTESLSKNNTTFKLKFNSRTYERHVMNLRHYNSKEAPNIYQLTHDLVVHKGAYVAVRDETPNIFYHIAKVTNIGEDTITVHYMGTSGSNLSSATWSLAYAKPHSGKIVFPKHQGKNKPLTGVITLEPDDEGRSLLIMPNVGLTPTSKVINKASRTLLKNTGLRHHTKGKTW